MGEGWLWHTETPPKVKRESMVSLQGVLLSLSKAGFGEPFEFFANWTWALIGWSIWSLCHVSNNFEAFDKSWIMPPTWLLLVFSLVTTFIAFTFSGQGKSRASTFARASSVVEKSRLGNR